MGVKGNQMKLINNGKDYSKSIVKSIGFYNKLSIENLMSKNRSRSECLLERVESIMIGGGVELSENVLLDKTYQWNDNVQVVENEPVIEISKT